MSGHPGRIVLFLPLLVACSSSTETLLTIWEGDLEPVPPATVGGIVAAVTQFGRTEASVHITDAEPESSYIWRIASGTCQGAGETQGGAAAYPPLTAGPSGSASAEAVLSAEFRPNRDYAAWVLVAEGGGEQAVACGPLRQEG